MPYISYTPEAEVNGHLVLTFVKALPMYSDIMTAILTKHGLIDVTSEGWYNLQIWLDALKEVSERYGPFTLMSIGKALPESFPADPGADFREIFNCMDPNYQTSHRNGDVGTIELTEYDDVQKQAKIRIVNPYPLEFAEGIIIGFLRKYKQGKGIVPKVVTEVSLENGDDRIYHTSW